MIYIGFPSGHPVCPIMTYACTREAERAASRSLGADWKSRGYRICYGEMPVQPKTRPQRRPRTAIRIGGNPKYGFLTDWHAG